MDTSEALSPNSQRAYISHNINSPDKHYVTMKFFPTGDRSPEPRGDLSLTRTQYETPDGHHRTTITTSKRSVLRSSSGGGLEAADGDVYLQHALNEMSRHAGPASSHEDDLKRTMEQIARDRVGRGSQGRTEQVVVRETVTQSSTPRTETTWMSRQSLRSVPETQETIQPMKSKPVSSEKTKPRVAPSDKKPLKAAPGSNKDRVLSPTGTALVWKSVESHDHLLKRYEPLPASSTGRLSSYVPREEPWTNVADDIVKSEVGEEAFKKRVEKQKKLFEAGAKKGMIFEELPLFFKKWGIRTLFEKKVRKTNQRATHSEGVGALGYAVVVENNRIPENDFFVPKKMFEIRARHANFPTIADDSRPAWRSLALKFQDHDYDSPLDLVLQTGRSTPFYNTDSIDEFYTAIVKSPAAFKEYLINVPANLSTIFEGMRKDIDSYTHVHYHSQMTYDFVARDGRKRVARFRVVPADGYPDTGRLKPEDQRELWYKMEDDLDYYTELLKEEHDRYESNQFLDAEFRRRVDDSTVTYNLQIQLREWGPEDTNALYNPAEIWDDSVTPWTDLAKIRLLSVLPDDITELTRFNVGHLPENTLQIPVPTSKSDFNTVPTIRREIYQLCSKLRSAQPPPPPKGDEVEYLVHVITGDRENAGMLHAKCDIYVCLVGRDSRTAFLRLTTTTKTEFGRGVRSTFTLRDKYVGDLLCVKVYKDPRGAKSDWFLESLVVSTTYNKTCSSLPCGRWFTDESPLHILRDGTPVLFDKESDFYLRRLRQAEVTMRQAAIRWRSPGVDPQFRGLPGYIAAGDNIDLLPSDMKSEAGVKLWQEWAKHMEHNDLLMKVRNAMKPRTKKKILDEAFEEELHDKNPDSKKNEMLKYIIGNWRSDLEFGRQMLNGVMPLKIARLKDIPKVFPLTDDMVTGLLEGSRTLRDELEAGRLFLVSYPELQEFVEEQNSSRDRKISTDSSSSESKVQDDNANGHIKSDKKIEVAEKSRKSSKSKEDKEPKKYACAPHVIMYLKGGVALLPLAIQMTQEPESPPLIYTPNDDTGEYSDWLVAKMWVKVAETNLHHLTARTLGTLLLLEPIAISVARNLPSVHPVSKLLTPYLSNLVLLNTIYRKFVICEDGALSEVLALGNKGVQLMRRQVSKFKKFSALNLPDNFSNRGVLEASQLPGYLYRDDALQLWEAIRDFVIDIVCVYYDDDDQVRNDDELALMLADLSKNGYNGAVDLPQSFARIEQLIQFCTTVIFRSTVQNTALTRGMADTYSFCLNAPPCLMNPPPREKRPYGYTLEYLHSLLPSSDLHDRYMNVIHLMTAGYKTLETTLGQYHDKTFTDEKAVIAIKSFQKQLKEISEQQNKRGRELNDWNYDYLQPGNIPVGFLG